MPRPVSSRPEPVSWQPLSGLRVLLAEDARGARHLYRVALERAGAEVTTVRGGGEAVLAWESAAADGLPFTAAVLDYVMPEMNGADVAAAIRAAGFRGAVIGISADLPDADAERWLAAGCDEVLPKGGSLEALVARVAARTRGAFGTSDPGRPR
ncbi:MAG TPA: response regulator [Planctomycetaceae bacterium]